MSYQMDLQDYTIEQLEKELELRRQANRQGLCEYCNRKLHSLPYCKFLDRHTKTVEVKE